MADDITQQHLDRARVRGAPSTIPGAAGMVGTYDYEEVQRNARRALAMDLGNDFTMPEMRAARDKLAQHAAKQKLKVVEQALIVLHADPVEDPPNEWNWTLVLPVSGRAQADEEAGISVTRIQGGAYIESITTKGFKDLYNLYTYVLGRLLPSHKQMLTRPEIYHRVVQGVENDNPSKCSVAVFVPFYLTLKAPTKLVHREEIG